MLLPDRWTCLMPLPAESSLASDAPMALVTARVSAKTTAAARAVTRRRVRQLDWSTVAVLTCELVKTFPDLLVGLVSQL